MEESDKEVTLSYKVFGMAGILYYILPARYLMMPTVYRFIW